MINGKARQLFMKAFSASFLLAMYFSSTAWAENPLPNYGDSVFPSARVLLASNMAQDTSASKSPDVAPVSRRWITLRKMHQYLGIASLGLASAAVLSPKPEDDDDDNGQDVAQAVTAGPHDDFAKAAAGTAVLASSTGLLFHLKDLNYGTGFYKDPDNWHAVLGSMATAAYVNAVSRNGSEGHAAIGIAGMTSMLFAIKLVW